MRNLKASCFIWPIAFIIFVGFYIGYDERFIRELTIIIAVNLQFWLTYGIMLWRTFQIDKEPQHKIDIQTRTPNSRTYSGNYETMLRDIITDENLKRSFSQFLQGEFCLENLLFWDEVERFKKLEGNDRVLKGEEIAKQFFTGEGGFLINIEGPMFLNIQQALAESLKLTDKSASPFANKEIFEEAATHIFSLMTQDSLMKWRKHSSFPSDVLIDLPIGAPKIDIEEDTN